MTDEKWKNFPMIEGRSYSKYEVSSLGQIRNKMSGYVFSAKPGIDGYIHGKVRDDEGNSRSIKVHIIVVRAFIGKPESNNLTVDHINRKRADNRVSNLRWATQKQQVANSDRSTVRCKGQPIIQYTMDMEEIKTWPNIITAERKLGIASSSISSVCKGKLKSAGGFKWVYKRQNLEGEIWRDYKPFDVQVSNMGRIKSSYGHIVYGSKTADCYLVYGLLRKRVHVMVAEIFLPNPENKPQVNHKDKNRVNNKVENLEWVTRSEQAIHSHQNSKPDRYGNVRAVNQYYSKGNLICGYKSVREASIQTGCSATAIYSVCLGYSKSIKGFRFEYANKDILNRPATNCPKKVYRIDENGNIIETYKSVKEASLDLEISCDSIYDNISGRKKKTRDGYRFKFKINSNELDQSLKD